MDSCVAGSLFGKCSYSTENVALWQNQSYCIFHLPKEVKNEKGWDPGSKNFLRFKSEFRKVIDDAKSKDTCADFSRCVFPIGMDFRDYNNENPFPYIEFQYSNFMGNADFCSTQFDFYANFLHSKFHGPAIFSNAVFNDKVNFSQIQPFNSNFKDAEFRSCSFVSVKFTDTCNFSNAKFKGPVDFTEARFEVAANFYKAKFGEIGTGNTNSKDKANFTTTTFLENANFNSAIFRYEVLFTGTTVEGLAEFRSSEFQFVPGLTNAKFQNDVDFEFAFFKTGTPIIFRKIKKIMEDQRHWWEATRFFAEEKRAENSGKNFIPKYFSLNFCYWLLNGYGLGYRRTLGWLGAFWFTGGFGYGYFDLIKPSSIWKEQLACAHWFAKGLIFSFQSLVLPFKWAPLMPTNLTGIIASSVQSFFGILLIGMALLSIRRRFKI